MSYLIEIAVIYKTYSICVQNIVEQAYSLIYPNLVLALVYWHKCTSFLLLLISTASRGLKKDSIEKNPIYYDIT